MNIKSDLLVTFKCTSCTKSALEDLYNSITGTVLLCVWLN